MRIKRDMDKQSIIRKALMEWLVSGTNGVPSCIGTDVVALKLKERFDVVAVSFGKIPRSSTRHVNYKSLFSTSAFICCSSREECWPDCADANDIALEISHLHEQKAQIESEIREKEPELKDSSVLFDELAEWNYEKSANPEYKGLQKNIAWLESILYLGNRIERLTAAPLADRLYIVVPENVLQPLELHEGWGLLWISEDGKVTVKREATTMDTPENAKLALVKRTMEASTKTVLGTVAAKCARAKKRIKKSLKE